MQPSINTRANSGNAGKKRASTSSLSAVRESHNEKYAREDDDDDDDDDNGQQANGPHYDEHDSLQEKEADTFSGPLHYVSSSLLSILVPMLPASQSPINA